MECFRSSSKETFFLFDSFERKGLKHFIIKDNRKIINEILLGLESFKQAHQKLTLVYRNFSRIEYKRSRNLVNFCIWMCNQTLIK